MPPPVSRFSPTLRKLHEDLLTTPPPLDDTLSQLDLTDEETQHLLLSRQYESHRTLRTQLLAEQTRLFAQAHLTMSIQRLRALAQSENPTTARLACLQLLHYAGLPAPDPIPARLPDLPGISFTNTNVPPSPPPDTYYGAIAPPAAMPAAQSIDSSPSPRPVSEIPSTPPRQHRKVNPAAASLERDPSAASPSRAKPMTRTLTTPDSTTSAATTRVAAELTTPAAPNYQLPITNDNLSSRIRHALRPLLSYRWLQLAIILGILAALVYDRYQLCTQYFFKYTDEDQVIMWYAADDLLKGRIAEPSYYGQNYNTCMEGFLAAPLGYLGMPWHIACPLVTIFLGLFPFLLFATIAWRRRHPLTAAATLLVPLLLPIRYAMMCGIPRGFQTGIAFAVIPAALLLPPPERRQQQGKNGPEPKLANSARQTALRRSWSGLRYFFAAALAIVSAQLGENCGLLLAPVAAYALLTSWREWKFWVFGLAGLLAALPYPLLVDRFYTKIHPDYVIYLRGDVFIWSWNSFQHYFYNLFAPRNSGGVVAPDLVPFSLPENRAPFYMLVAFIALAAWLLIRRRTAGLAAAFIAAVITFVSFGYTRVYQTTTSANTASFPYARMYLAIPVVFIYLLFLANHKPWPRLANSTAARWITRGALAGFLVAALHAVALRTIDRPREIREEVNATGGVVCPAIPVAQFYATAHEIQKIAEKEHADLVLIGGGDRMKHLAYALRPVIGIDAIYGPWERRAWRMIEESTAHHDAILFVNHSMPSSVTQAGGGKAITVDDNGNTITDLPPLPRSARFRPATAPPSAMPAVPSAGSVATRPAAPASAPAAAPGPPPVSLPRNIDLAKVSFTSLNGSKNYLPGKDFSVELTDNAQLLRRTPTSAIAEGETILLSWKGIATYTVPSIYLLKTDGKNAYQAGVPGLASVFTPAASKSNPHPTPQVIGNGR